MSSESVELIRNKGAAAGNEGVEPDVADLVAAAVRLVPGVSDLHPGRFGEAATYLPGRRVQGIQVRPTSTHVHVVITWGVDIGATADAIRAVVQPIVGTSVDVTVQDLAAPTPQR